MKSIRQVAEAKAQEFTRGANDDAEKALILAAKGDHPLPEDVERILGCRIENECDICGKSHDVVFDEWDMLNYAGPAICQQCLEDALTKIVSFKKINGFK